jgi:hypothetical protein
MVNFSGGRPLFEEDPLPPGNRFKTYRILRRPLDAQSPLDCPDSIRLLDAYHRAWLDT